MSTIKFYANFKNGKFFISGKNEKGDYYSLWKNPNLEGNEDFYLDIKKFRGGLEIDKTELKLLPREDGEPSKVLVCKTAEIERKYLISKEEVEKQKNSRKSSGEGVKKEIVEYVLDLFECLYLLNPDLALDGLLKEELMNKSKNPAEAEVTEDDDLPF